MLSAIKAPSLMKILLILMALSFAGVIHDAMTVPLDEIKRMRK